MEFLRSGCVYAGKNQKTGRGAEEEGIQYGLNHDKWLLLDAPGLGKSLQLIYLAQEIKKRDSIEHCLIICGVNGLKYNWRKEIKKHSDEGAFILGTRYKHFDSRFEFRSK